LHHINDKLSVVQPGTNFSSFLDSFGLENIRLAEEVANVASILEWGFEQILWELEDINDTLKRIEKTLKRPTATKANEWRQMGETLRKRGDFWGAKKFFLKSLEEYPIDYRTYIGLGKTYLCLGSLENARDLWRRSLIHAPKDGDMDYRSYSYRLIGRSYFCQENYAQAAESLNRAVEKSPSDLMSCYDLAQYTMLIGKKEEFFKVIRQAARINPSIVSLARVNPLFSPIFSFLSKSFQAEMEFRNPWLDIGVPEDEVDQLILWLEESWREYPLMYSYPEYIFENILGFLKEKFKDRIINHKDILEIVSSVAEGRIWINDKKTCRESDYRDFQKKGFRYYGHLIPYDWKYD